MITLKNTKIILFAGLIAAMVLPFSGMQFVVAEEVNKQDTKTIQEIERHLSNTQYTYSYSEESNYKEKQLKLALQWFEAKESNDIQKMDSIMEEIKSSFPTVYNLGTDKLETRYDRTRASSDGYMGPINYNGSAEKRWDCRDRSDMFGYMDGTITMFPGAIYSANYMHYPRIVTVGPQGIDCSTMNWNHSVTNITSLTTNPNDNCKIDTFSSSMDAEGKYCTKVEAGMIVVIEGQSFYSSGNSHPFSVSANDTILFLWEF